MKTLSVVSKLTISIITVCCLWWLLNEYQTYRQILQQQKTQTVIQHKWIQRFNIELTNNFLQNVEMDLKNYRDTLPHIDEMAGTQSGYFYVTGNHSSVSTNHQHFFQKMVAKHYSNLLLKTSMGIEIMSRVPLTKFQQQSLAKHFAEASQTAKKTVQWHSLNGAQSSEFLANLSDSRTGHTYGVTIDIAPLLAKLNQESNHQQMLLLTTKNQFIPSIPNELQQWILKELQHPQKASQLIDPHHGDSYFYISKLQHSNWALISRFPRQEVSSVAKEIFISKLPHAISLLIVFTLLLIIIFYIVLKRPLAEYIQTIRDRNTPALKRHLPTQYGGEFSEIANAYNEMLDKIQLHQQKLEFLVAERTQDLLAASRKAEQANQRKTEHLTSISHEIRTPLNGILGVQELLLSSHTSERQKKLIRTAIDCGYSLLSLVNNLLDFSRIEAKQIQLKPYRYSTLKVVDEAMSTIASQAQSKGVLLITVIQNNVPEFAIFDPDRVRQILINLLGNAIKFTEEGYVSIGVTLFHKQIKYRVKDTGIGIKNNELITIFEPYVQGRHHKVGSGLGLPIARKLARLMGGDILTHSRFGHGASFSLKIPLQSPESSISLLNTPVPAPSYLHPQLKAWGATPTSPIENQLSAPELRYLPDKLLQYCREIQHDVPHFAQSTLPPLLPWKLKVLVVDDVDINREIMSQMLQELGQSAYTASGANAAINMGHKHIFDLILMDIRMPDIDGYQATAMWRSDEQILDNACPIFALTANAESFTNEQLASAGINHYLVKPISLRSLNEALELAAEFQLEREVQPTINSEADTPLIDVLQTDLNQKLYSQLTEMLLSLKAAIESKNWQFANHWLHTLKGTSGLAALKEIEQEVTILEDSLEQNKSLALPQLKLLNQLIKAVE
ncbi:ATP-binding protein [Parashewanella curva]|nr:ATP-binding protein [Parashewanella curva]